MISAHIAKLENKWRSLQIALLTCVSLTRTSDEPAYDTFDGLEGVACGSVNDDERREESLAV